VAVVRWLWLLAWLEQGFRSIGRVEVSGPLTHEIGDWVHLEAIQALVYHATAVVATLLLTAVTGFAIQRLMKRGPVKRIVVLIDQIAAALLILFFMAELALYFWRK